MQRTISVLLLAFASILLGTATSIGLALCCAYWSSIQTPIARSVYWTSGQDFQAMMARGFGLERWRMERQMTSPSLPLHSPRVLRPPPWVDLRRDNESSLLWSLEAIGAGWPCVCLRAESAFDLANFSITSRVWSNGYVVQEGTRLHPFSTIVLPLEPVWKGLAANAAALGSGWFGVIMVLRWSRRRRRHARGWCVRCGYDLRASTGIATVCPECGANITARRAA